MIENGGAGKTLTAERGEYVREKTAVARLERLEKEGSLVPADEVMLAWGQYTANATTVLLAIPSDIGAVWSTIKSAGQAADEVRGRIHRALERLNATEFYLDDDHPPAAAE